MGKIPVTDHKSWNRTGNRSNPHPGASDAPALIVQGEGVGRPKRTQKEFALHPSSTLAQARGRAHPVPGVDPMAPLRADNDRGKPTPRPEVTFGARGPINSSCPSRTAHHSPELGDAVLDEAHMNTRLLGERHHSCCGPKGAFKPGRVRPPKNLLIP